MTKRTQKDLGKVLTFPKKDRPIEESNSDNLENLIFLSPKDIDFFDGDVRVTGNASFKEIKASINRAGLDNPLPIAKHPRTGRWMIYGGGNTRLKACIELKLEKVPCREHLWSSNTDALMRHLRENDLRTGYTFYERCLAAQQLITDLKAGTKKKVTVDLFAKSLEAAGYPTSSGRKLYVYYEFALILYKHIPKALEGGLGQNAVADLTVEYNRATNNVSSDDKIKIKKLYFDCLVKFDSDTFKFSAFINEFRTALSKLFPDQAKLVESKRANASKKKKASSDKLQSIR